MNIKNYFDRITLFLKGNSNVVSVRVEKKIISTSGGYLRLRITFLNGSVLDVREYVDDKLRKLSYSYNFLSSKNTLIFRYDNAPHHKEVETFPYHVHISNGEVRESEEKDIYRVKREIGGVLSA